MTTITTNHSLVGRARKLAGPGIYTASCSCGWTSPRRVTAQKAYGDVEEHITEENQS